MVPKLYGSDETAFTSEGLGRLTECTRCHVKEVRNGEYECEFVYPVTGRLFSSIEEGSYIACIHDDDGDVQPFKIYRRSAPIDGRVTFNARHISYLLNHVIVSPFEAHSAVEAMAALSSNAINNNPFTFSTDKTTLGTLKTEEPRSVRQIMGGDGGILDIYAGGEYDFNLWHVDFKAHRGNASGVQIRYGKNLISIDQEKDAGETYNAVVPFWRGTVNDVETLVTVTGYIVSAAGASTIIPVVLDLSNEFDDQPSEAELRTAAENYLAESMPWLANESIKVNFAQLWQTAEYEDRANLQRLRLCDTVSVYYPALGVSADNIKIVSVDYDVLTEKYISMELGQVATRFESLVATTDQMQSAMQRAQEDTRSFMDAAVYEATQQITGAAGGHVVIGLNANNEPEEILIMNTDSLQTATLIIRLNMNGIGFSTNGGQTYSTAWTIDGHFVADYITTGTLRAILIEGPDTLTKWDLTTGIFDNHGESEVTAQVETAEGVYTPQTYDVDHITRISGGLLRLLATIDDAQTQTELFSLGLAGEGMSYDFYKDNNDSGSTFSYPYAGLNFNAPTVTGKSGIIWTQNRGTTATYTPYAHISPDTLVLGGYKNLVTQIAGEVPNRNPLHLNGGWVSPENAIFLEQHYQIVEIPGGTSKEWYDFKRRVAWEICPGDNLEIGMWRGAGIYSNSKKDIRLTIPLCRPISADVKTIEVFCTVNRAWQQGTAIVSANVDTSGSVVESWNLTGVVVSIRKDDGTAWSGTSTGTNNAPIAVQLLNLQLIFWGDEFSE